MDSSDFLTFLQRRSSVREYDGTAPGEDCIAFILQCARTAPSAGNREGWDVVIVTDPSLREGLSEAAFEQRHVGEAPAVLVVCANYIRSMSQYGERGILYAVQDATIAATFMMLAAHAAGLQTCWTGAFDEDAVRELLALPQHVRPVALLTVGYGTLPAVRTGRMPVADHVHRETWL
ncbi:MAG: nitroreductase [Methanomicrobiales archaeon]|nr:nitroreductase [Methanomicrobiales archaeon]